MGARHWCWRAPVQAEWPGLISAPAWTLKKRCNKKKWHFRVMTLEATYQRHQAEDVGPPDGKVSQGADAADQWGGEVMGLFPPWSTLGTRLWTTNFSRALKKCLKLGVNLLAQK